MVEKIVFCEVFLRELTAFVNIVFHDGRAGKMEEKSVKNVRRFCGSWIWKAALCVITFRFHIAPFLFFYERENFNKQQNRGDAMEVIKSNSFLCVCFHSCDKHSKPSCVFCSRRVEESEEFVQNTKFTQRKTPPESSFSRSPLVYARFILNYFLWPFAIIKKSSFEPFVYSARLFLLLIDFLLHIMGIPNRMKRRREAMRSLFE